MNTKLKVLLLAFVLYLSSAHPVSELNVDYEKYIDEHAEELGGYYQGDMILDEYQKETIELGMRSGLVDEYYRWPDRTVFYEIDSAFEHDQKDYIQQAFSKIEEVTCIKFKPRKSDTKGYIHITGEKSGCRSHVGYSHVKQNVNLHSYGVGHGCFRLGTIIHELLHSLGFYHQQSSYNRDDYVEIVEENIKERHEKNFKKVPKNIADDFGVPYDYGSVMHYSATEFSKNGKPTIIPKDKSAVIGQRKGLSKKDIKKINLMYKCPPKNE